MLLKTKTQKDVVRTTHRTRTILGVTCTAVSDIATHNGTVLERTTDWYAQDTSGNVWYFGERTADYTGGGIDRSGRPSTAGTPRRCRPDGSGRT